MPLSAMRRSALTVALSMSCLLAACGDGGGLGMIEARAWFEPEILDFGEVRVGDTRELRVQLRTTGVGTERIKVIFENNGDFYSARTAEGTLHGSFLPPSGTVDIDLIYGPGVQGDRSSILAVEVGEARAELVLEASARARARPTPELTPQSIDFGNVELGRDAMVTFELKNSGESEGTLVEIRPKSPTPNSPFAITTRGGGNPISAKLDPDRAETLMLEAHFEPDSVGVYAEDLELVFDSGATATLAVQGNAMPAGTLSCDTTDHDFGSVDRGTTARKQVRCMVTGGAYSIDHIGAATGSSPLFAVPNAPARVEADGSLVFEITFDGRGVARPHLGTIEIASLHRSSYLITVRGEVAPPPPGLTDISVTLTWNTDESDFDLHLVRRGGMLFDAEDDCYYGANNPDWGAPNETLDNPFLDRDERDGFGPEQLNLSAAVEESFDLYVHFYDYESSRPPPTEVSVTVNLLGMPAGTFVMPMDACGTTWHVGQFNFGVTPAAFVADTMLTNAYRNRSASRCQ